MPNKKQNRGKGKGSHPAKKSANPPIGRKAKRIMPKKMVNPLFDDAAWAEMDAEVRTPDAELDPSERDDQPEEVAANATRRNSGPCAPDPDELTGADLDAGTLDDGTLESKQASEDIPTYDPSPQPTESTTRHGPGFVAAYGGPAGTMPKPHVPGGYEAVKKSFSGLAAKLRDNERKESAGNGDTSPHLVVIARAGTGKTTTLVDGTTMLLGGKSKLTPSPQQKAVWDAICLSRGKVRTVGFVAFNRSIRDELKRRVPRGCDAMTMHGMGFKAVARHFDLNGDKVVNDDRVVRTILPELTGIDVRALWKTKAGVVRAVRELVDLCKMNLVEWECVYPGGFDEPTDPGEVETKLDEVSRHYGVEIKPEDRPQVYELVPRVLERCKDVKKDKTIDYADMIWLPVVLALNVFKYDMLLVDEAQDLNRCQQALAKMAGRRLVLCGDDKQAIYGFAGADAESIPRMIQELGGGLLDGSGDGAPLGPGLTAYKGCQVLPLTVTRRCGKKIVEEARLLVPEFEAHESNPDGVIAYASYPVRKKFGREEEVPYEETYLPLVKEGDMVLCRANAPLVRECFRFLKQGRKAFINGRDVGANLISLVEKMQDANGGSEDVPQMIASLIDWEDDQVRKEQAEPVPSESKIQGIRDRVDCIRAFASDAITVGAVVRKIKDIFADKECPTCGARYDAKVDYCKNATGNCVGVALVRPAGIMFSSGHKAKGLEADRVFYIRGFGPPFDKLKDWEIEQENNLCYVITTRAKEYLCYVD